MKVLVAPASLKGVLSARDAASAIARGIREAGHEATELPVADGGEGTLDMVFAARGGKWHHETVPDAFGHGRIARWLELRDGAAILEAAEAIPLDASHLDALSASSRGLGVLIAKLPEVRSIVVGLGGVATTDGGKGLLEVLDELPAPTNIASDVNVELLDAAVLFAPQKGATPEDVATLIKRLGSIQSIQPFASLEGAGAAGGLGAAFASLGATLMSGARYLLDLVHFDPSPFDLVITGEGTVDLTTTRGKAPGIVAEIARNASVACIVFGGRVEIAIEGADVRCLSGDPNNAHDDLVALGASAVRDRTDSA